MANPCRRCGECLSRCIYLRLTRDEAAIEMRRLDEGRPTPHLDRKCISCMACNAFCPHGADPYDRILHHLYARYLSHGLPSRMRFMLPTEATSFRTEVLKTLPADEKALVQQWASNEPRGEMLYPSCNLIISSFLTQSGIFDDLTIAGSLELCCGEMYYRMGLFDLTRSFADRLTAYYADKSIKRMIFVCPACYNMFAHILPEQFGARFDFPRIFYLDYLRERMERGALTFPEPLSGKVVIHDSCQGRVLGPEFMDQVRDLLRQIGLTPVEARYAREEGLCCGIAAGAPRQSVMDLVKVSTWAHNEYGHSSGEQVATYCAGCFLTLGATGMLLPGGRPVTHLLALLAKAMGRPVEDRLDARARALLLGIVRHALPRYLSFDRFWIK